MMDLKNLLQEIDLWDNFPGKLKRQDLLAFNKCTINQTKDSELKHVFSKFVSDLMHYDSNCMSIETSKTTYLGFRSRGQNHLQTNTKPQHVHPLDLSTLLFLACDPVARQDIVDRFWGCKHAFPFIVQLEQLTSPKLYFWPLRGLIAKGNVGEQDAVVEQAVAKLKYKIVSFLRFSGSELSKSDTINHIIDRTDKVSSVFFHRDSTGSTPIKVHVTDGMVEAFPYIKSERVGGPTLFLNLRGNPLDFIRQGRYLMSISNMVIIFLEMGNLERVKEFVANYKRTSKVLLLTDISTDEVNDRMTSMFTEFEQSNNAVIDTVKGERVAGVAKQLVEVIYKRDISVSLENCIAKAREFEIDVDEDDIKKELADAEEVITSISERYGCRNQNSLFPVQGKEYLEYAKADLEYYKLRRIPSSEPVSKYRDILQGNIHKCREIQYSLTLNENLTTLMLNRYQSADFDIFLRSLKLRLDHLTRVNVNRIFGEYKALFAALRISDQEVERERLSNKLKDLDERMNDNALSVSDFVREMGQIFESRNWFHNREYLNVPTAASEEARAAVRILLEGYPIELMDGRSCSVPLDWIKAVLSQLRNIIGKARLKIVSVLGLESSGKSTLLNVMFGCLFPIGSGRCTRGVYMYLLKTAPGDVSMDYILVIDSEGLFSTATYLEKGARGKQERELATFVIGLSTVTILNIMGENIDYLKDALPISVYAFLRMMLVGLSPKCKLLHHNVDKMRKLELGWQAKILENALDKSTMEACDLEKVPRRGFKDVILFDPATDVYYFPSLFEDSHLETDHQNTISNFYSKEAKTMKNDILSDDSGTTIDELILNLDRLWNAVKRENFVYEFSTIIDAEARAVLDNKHCEFTWQIMSDIQSKTLTYQEKVYKSLSTDDLDAIKQELKSEMEQYAQSKRDQFMFTLNNSLDDFDNVLAIALKRLSKCCRQDLLKIADEFVDEIYSTIDRDIRLREKEIKFKQGDRHTEESINQFISLGFEESTKLFDPEKQFENWASEKLYADRILSKEQLEEDAIECLYAVFSSHRVTVDEIKPLEANSFKTFRPLSEQYGIERIEFEVANKLVKDVNKYCSKVMDNIKHRKRFYHRSFFREIPFYIKRERQRLGNRLNVTHTFDVHLAAAACSHLTDQLRQFDIDKGLLSFNMTSSIKSYFVAKCIERKGGVTKTKEIVDGCCNVIENSIVEKLVASQSDKTTSILAIHIVKFLMARYSFFRSKLGLMCFVWKQLLLEDNSVQLQEYIMYPLASIKSSLAALFNQDVSGIEDNTPSDASLHERILMPLVNELVGDICDLLLSKSTSELGHSLADLGPFLKCIVQTIEPVLDITDILKYQGCSVEILGTDVFIQMLVQRLRSDFFLTCLVSRIHLNVLEKNMVHDDIRLQVVNSLYSSVIGCEEKCNRCGALCSSIQKFHEGRHSTTMHIPSGFRDLLSRDVRTMSTAPCVERSECDSSHESESLQSNWSATGDVDRYGEDSNFWKYMFVSHARNMAQRLRKTDPPLIPESWRRISKCEVLNWLEKHMS